MTKIPSDNHIRTLLNLIPASTVFVTVKTLWEWLNINQTISHFKYLDNQILLALDGTEYYGSKNINCPLNLCFSVWMCPFLTVRVDEQAEQLVTAQRELIDSTILSSLLLEDYQWTNSPLFLFENTQQFIKEKTSLLRYISQEIYSLFILALKTSYYR